MIWIQGGIKERVRFVIGGIRRREGLGIGLVCMGENGGE